MARFFAAQIRREIRACFLNCFLYNRCMKYFAHRGASAYMPENSLPAFALAREMGAVHYELDVHMTRDHFVVVHHDYTLHIPSGREVSISSLSVKELAKYPLPNHVAPAITAFAPALKDVLPIIEEEMQTLNIEVKNDDNLYPGIEKLLLQKLKRYSPEVLAKTLFSSFDYPTLERLRALDGNIRLGMLCREFDIEKAKAICAGSVHMNQTRITKEIVDSCHKRGMEVLVYTVNDVYSARQLERLGVDGIFTDRLDLFVKTKCNLEKVVATAD